MAALLNFDEPFERAGIWWMASQPASRVAGTLTYDPEAGVVLQLVGSFGPHPFSALQRAMAGLRYETIHGITVDGKEVTLLRAVQKGSQFHMGGMSLESYLAIWTLIGAHLTDENQLAFVTSLAQFDGLDAWLGRQPITDTLHDDPRRLIVTCAPMADLPMGQISAGPAEVFARMTLHTSGDRQTRFEAQVSYFLGVTPATPQNLLWHLDQVEHLNRLVSLCTGRHLPMRAVRLLGPDRELAPGMTAPHEIDLLMRVNEPAGSPGSSDPPIFSVAEMLSANPDALSAWFSVEADLKPVLDLFFTVLSEGLYADIAFLLAVQAWEVHHRLTKPGPLLEKAAFKALRKTLVEAIPEQTPVEMKTKLEAVLSFANEPSLRQRIDATLAALEPVYGSDAFGFDDKTRRAVVDSRNYYTHYSRGLEAKATPRTELVHLTRRIVPLLYALILPSLGATDEVVREHLKRRRSLAPYVTGPAAEL